METCMRFCEFTIVKEKQKDRYTTEWEIFVNHTPDKRLVSKIFKELLELNNTKTKNPIK